MSVCLSVCVPICLYVSQEQEDREREGREADVERQRHSVEMSPMRQSAMSPMRQSAGDNTTELDNDASVASSTQVLYSKY